MKRKHISFIIFIIGVSIIAYPWVTKPLNLIEENEAMEDYYLMMEDLSPELEEELIDEYEQYNTILAGEDIDGEFADISDSEFENNNGEFLDENGEPIEMTDEEGGFDTPEKNSNGEFTNGRLLGTINVPKLKLKVPLYQGATQDNLRKGAGHISGTSLPTGEVGGHAVFAGHNRYRNKKLFTTIHKLNVGDTFNVESLGKSMSYKVVDTIVVEPYETDYLLPVEGKDKVTLLTCSYFGKKRLLIMGERDN